MLSGTAKERNVLVVERENLQRKFFFKKNDIKQFFSETDLRNLGIMDGQIEVKFESVT